MLFPFTLHYFGQSLVSKLSKDGGYSEEDVDVKREKLKVDRVVVVSVRISV